MNGITQNFTYRILLALFLLCFISGCQTTAEKPVTLETKVETLIPKIEPIPAPTSLTPAPETPKIYSDVWAHIRDGYGLPDASNDSIDAELNWFVNYRKYFSGITAQAEPYLFYVVSELQANQVPLEISLLPFIESAYNPSARSPGAQSNVGMWQIAPITGRHFGLGKNNWYEGRKDVIVSTDVAIKLLKQMYTQFDNDWLLAIAAYNAGEVIVRQAIQKNTRLGKPTDFWSLPLPKTTQHYVAKIYAFSKIVKNPDVYKFELAAIPDQAYFMTLTVGPQINLAQLAELASLDANHLKNINAGFNSWITDPTSQRSLIVPVAKANNVQAVLDSLPPVPLMKWIEHKVKPGDTLYDLARHYGVSVQTIIANNGIKNNNLQIGRVLQIPINNN